MSRSLALFISLNLLMTLACSAVQRLVEAPRPTAAPTATTIVVPTAPAETNPPAPEADPDAMQLANGLRLGSHAATERAIAEGVNILENVADERYDSANLSQAGEVYPFTITLARSLDLLWQTGWCTTSEDLLIQNWEHITLEFLVNGEPIDADVFVELVGSSANNLYCQSYAVVVSGWPSGETVLTTRVTFEEAINDGLADYPAGTHEYEYRVQVR